METNMTQEKASAIVCAYNEEDTISKVLENLLKSSIIDEIIVINDGSTDSTQAVIQTFSRTSKIRPIEFQDNRGKGNAMAEGVINARNRILVFVDADLLNLEDRYIEQLVQPLVSGLADMVIGPPTENTVDDKFNPFKPLSGERALFRDDILPLVENMRESRFGVETLINLSYQSKKKRVLYVPLWGLVHPIKLQKHSFKRASREYCAAANQILRTVIVNYSLVTVLIQNLFRR
jgi:glycosyltransferase involved in cell wall biosynthesis